MHPIRLTDNSSLSFLTSERKEIRNLTRVY